MEGRRLALVIAVILAALVAAVWLLPTLRRARLPELVRAHVGIEVGSDGIARVGRVRIPAGEDFRLHAIVEAKTSRGEVVYYTDATQVQFLRADGASEPVAARSWKERPEPVRLLWLTLEGAAPYRELASGETLERFAFEEFSHPEWGTGWSAKGGLEARRDDALQLEGRTSGLAFGTQHFQVWVEILAREGDAFPARRLKSAGNDELLADPGAAPAVEATLAGALEAPSRVFGLSQVEPPPDAAEPLLAELATRYREGLLFSRALLLRDVLDRADRTIASLAWQRLDLQAEQPWDRVQPGDLLRVGARWVVLFRDEGTPGVIDGGDLCLDYERGAVVRRISSVFVEIDDPEGGEVEWASLETGSSLPKTQSG